MNNNEQDAQAQASKPELGGNHKHRYKNTNLMLIHKKREKKKIRTVQRVLYNNHRTMKSEFDSIHTATRPN